MKILILSLLFSLSSWAGNSVENGGDTVAFEFATSARMAVANLKASKLSPELKKIVQTIDKSVESTKVNSQENLFLNGNEVDAINYPLRNQILVSRIRWIGAKFDSVEARMGFVLHEYLGVSNIDDGEYKTSQKLVEAFTGDLYSNLVEQKAFIGTLNRLSAYFWQVHSDAYPHEGHKGVCMEAGEINLMARSITSTALKRPKWFRSNAIKKFAVTLSNVSSEIRAQCLSEEVNYAILQKNYTLGHETLGEIRFLMFSR